MREVPMSTCRSKTWRPPDVMGACRAAVGKFLEIPECCKPVAKAGAIMWMHSAWVKVDVGIAYFSLAEMVVCNAVQAALGVVRPRRSFPAHCRASFLK